jgi:hypothetical protein
MKTYKINVPSGEYITILDDDSCAYDAYEFFLRNNLTIDDVAKMSENFDVYNYVTIVRD